MEKAKTTPAGGVDTVVQKTERLAAQAKTVLWNDLPKWMHDNHYIHSGYRPQSNSYTSSAASIGYLHNESVNIWSHLIGAVMAFVAAFVLSWSIAPRFELATNQDVMVFSAFFLGAVTCLGMSATYHTISNHSEAVAKFGNRLDYMGIVFLIWGSFIPSIFYGFSKEPKLIRLYWSMVRTNFTSSRREYQTDDIADHNYRSWDTCRSDASQVQIASMAALQSLHVRHDGFECCRSSDSRSSHLRLQAVGESNWTFVARLSRGTIHTRSSHLCCKKP